MKILPFHLRRLDKKSHPILEWLFDSLEFNLDALSFI